MSAGVAVGQLGKEKEEQHLLTGLQVDVIPRNTNSQQPPTRQQTLPSLCDYSWKLRTPVSLTQEELKSASAAWLPGQLSEDGKELNFLTENDTKFMLRWAEGLLAETTEFQKSESDLLKTVNNGEMGKAKQGVNQQGCFPVYTQAQRQETPINSQHLGDPFLPRNTNKTPNKRTFPSSQKCTPSLACATARPDVQWYKCCTGSSTDDIVAQYASGRTVNVLQLDGVLFTFDDPQAVQALSTQKTGDVNSSRRPACRRQLWPDDQQNTTRTHDITEGAPWYFNFPQKIRGGTSKRPMDSTTDSSEAPTPMPHGEHQQAAPMAHMAKRRQLDRNNRTYKGSGLQA
ncbi:PREDICTED: uncharacterized protein LOC109487148 [Branchiostoma belcheri]|uniref:Uncharacterized protein LOC109487148 n=1 Tax=Branchiostoma belcheri TaxID=7741 RepID=A0A6P5AKA9_BRABE|nr:PREDICTED: uncharacterized protein LOC109487148 [Branchiostoma belcheri]